MIKQRYTYRCIKCHRQSEINSDQNEPKLIPLDRCSLCGYSAKEARKINKLKKVTLLLEEVKSILETI